MDNAKARYDKAYDFVQDKTAEYQRVIEEQGTYKDRLRAKRQELLDAKGALKSAANDVQRESSIPLSGRPPGNRPSAPVATKASNPVATKKKGKS